MESVEEIARGARKLARGGTACMQGSSSVTQLAYDRVRGSPSTQDDAGVV